MSQHRRVTLKWLATMPHSVRTGRDGGEEWRLACPLHGGTNPTSFSLSLASGLYHCFSCGASGRLTEFETSPLNLSRSNPKKCYEKYPLPPPALDQTKATTKPILLKPRSKPQVERTRRSQRLGEWRRARAVLENQEVATYLQSRGITLATARQSGLGYVAHYRFSLNKAVNDQEVKTNSSSASPLTPTIKPQSYYAGAVLFPLYDETGLVNYYARGLNHELRLHHIPSGSKGLFNPVALCAGQFRPIGDRVVCSVGHEDSPSQAAQTQKEKEKELLIVVEGGFDALALLEAGYHRVVALIGTSLLKPDWFRHEQAVGLAFDRDEVGQRATVRAIAELKRYGIECFVLDWSHLLANTATLLSASSNSSNSQSSLPPKDLAALWQHELAYRPPTPTPLSPPQRAISSEHSSSAQSWLRRVLNAMVQVS